MASAQLEDLILKKGALHQMASPPEASCFSAANHAATADPNRCYLASAAKIISNRFA